jgi:type I restriction-modification system DNA methylase subunit
MARSAVGEAWKQEHTEPLRILDPACGSGRMLVVAAELSEKKELYFGIDIDLSCVKMTILNLFLNGIFHAEALCTDFLLPREFRGSYVTSFLPFGIFRIREKEDSLLWHLVQNHPRERPQQKLPSEQTSDRSFSPDNSQLNLF